MSIFSRLFVKRTHFKGGGLRLTPVNVMCKTMAAVGVPSRFVAPKKLDFRDMCIQTSNQGDKPHCAGYATAGHIEVTNWKLKHYPEQVDGDAIYLAAKKIDGDDVAGTTLDSAANAAINLGLTKGKPKYVPNEVDSVKFAVHQFNTCIGGFMITEEYNFVTKDGTITDAPGARALGGHAMLICGYDPEYVYIQNSWGEDWGLYGFCRITWAQFSRQFMSGMVLSNEL